MLARAYVGTSGYSYKEWKGKFYPTDLPADGMLRFYTERLPTVEINNTFYRMPSSKLVEGWASEAPDGFLFAVKAPQRITHQKRLKDAGEPLQVFLAVARKLGAKLGPLLFQLPPNLKKDLPRLSDFLALLPEDLKVAFEFRHASWFEDDVLAALRAKKVALCVAETEDLVAPLVATADWGYLRLRRAEYPDDVIDAWAKRILEPPWSEAYVYVKHDEGDAPSVAAKLSAKLAASPAARTAPEPLVRLVQKSDVDGVVRLVRDVLAEFGLRFGEGATTDDELAHLPSSYEEGGGAFWVVAGEGGEILGTCGMFPIAAGTFELRKMYLRPSLRGRGFGQKLLDASLSWARTRGGRRVVLDTTEQMKRAIAFYESNGFVRDDSQVRGARCSRGYGREL